jgi:DNA end-binding protein Ku
MIAHRPIWRGHIRLALVSCPVALYSSRHDRASIHFHMINPETGNRIKMVTQDAETGHEIARRDTIKGYEVEKGQYVIVTPEDLDSVKVESSSTMTVEKFVEAGSIDPIYYDTSYYLAPDGKGAEDVYAVLREAIQKTGMVALTRVVISQRERTVALRPLGTGLAAHSLHEQRDLNAFEPLFEPIEQVSVDPEMVKLAVQLIDRQVAQYDPADLEDRYETRLRAMIDAKVAGDRSLAPSTQLPEDSNVVDLMAALRASLRGPGSRDAQTGLPPRAARSKKTPEESRRQPGLKLPIKGGGKPVEPAQTIPAPIGRSRRKAS